MKILAGLFGLCGLVILATRLLGGRSMSDESLGVILQGVVSQLNRLKSRVEDIENALRRHGIS